jgi:LmbE family N-acetylglucosaminyl deacetylase
MTQDLNGLGKVILAIGAHPDDIEFGCGATMAKLSQEGARLYFVIATMGNRGSRAHKIEREELVKNRKKEQQDAAKILGAEEVIFLDHPDGELQADIHFKEEVVRLIRRIKPDIVFTHDPTWHYVAARDFSRINHTDHRACGSAVLDAIYPLSRDTLSFPDHLDEGLTPHTVKDVILFQAKSYNLYVDVTNFADKKVESIWAHKSQIDHPEMTEKFVKERLKNNGKKKGYKFSEAFTRLSLR